jgi:hydrogenase maturation factor/phosphoheptose isomerase
MTSHAATGETVELLAADVASAAFTLARRFAAGATLWCWAPRAPEHAQHVAVEFVHPVIVGKRALPAVAVTTGEAPALSTLRALVRAGDVLVIVGAAAADEQVAAVLRRAPSWGAATILIGAGHRPDAGVADHVLWLDGDAGLAPHDGRFVLVYHLLWELTHVCFEHPGLLQAEENPCEGPSCITCSDEGNVAEVVRATAASAIVRTATGVEEIDTSIVGDVGPGDLVLVHAGTALTIIDEHR